MIVKKEYICPRCNTKYITLEGDKITPHMCKKCLREGYYEFLHQNKKV